MASEILTSLQETMVATHNFSMATMQLSFAKKMGEIDITEAHAAASLTHASTIQGVGAANTASGAPNPRIS